MANFTSFSAILGDNPVKKKKEKRKRKGFSRPFLKEKEINKEKESSGLTIYSLPAAFFFNKKCLTNDMVSVIMVLNKSFTHLSADGAFPCQIILHNLRGA